MSKAKEKADERGLDILDSQAQPSSKMPWEKGPAPQSTNKKSAVISSLLNDDPPPSKPSPAPNRQPAVQSPLPISSVPVTRSSVLPQASALTLPQMDVQSNMRVYEMEQVSIFLS